MFKFSLLYFLIAFSFGIIACYVMTPSPKIVIKFPSPKNVGDIVYHDKEENCYTFKADKVKCTKDAVHQSIILSDGE